MSHGRRLPTPDSRFATVDELFAMPHDERERYELWLGRQRAGLSEWMPLADLLSVRTSTSRSSLAFCPSSLVVVVRALPDGSP